MSWDGPQPGAEAASQAGRRRALDEGGPDPSLGRPTVGNALTQIDLKSLDNRQLAAIGDGALRARAFRAAWEAYRILVQRFPGHAHVRARLGLAAAPSRRAETMLDVLVAAEQTGAEHAFVSDGLATWLKTLPFQGDARFMELADRHSDLLPIPNWHWNLNTALWAARTALRQPGDFVELGVFKGHTTLFLAEYLEFQKEDRTWWLYDTFEGVPDDQADDQNWRSMSARVYQGTFSLEEVRQRFAHFPNVNVIQGRVPQILAEQSPERIAFLHVDLNNAAAEIGALDVLYDRVSPGGVILFDDFAWAVSKAQYEAETAWFAARGLSVLALPTGQGLFVKT